MKQKAKVRKIICVSILLIKDILKLLIQCLIATTLCSTCMVNGWIFSFSATNISRNEFWKMYSAMFVLVPIIMFYRGVTGRYHVEIKEEKDESAMGTAKLEV